ncbi:DUF2913 family protein [Vibrio parahaemolyticus]|uniref:DUF2913 family protein n=1 Tax=Vibrio parahaemolyticus TaxID=670 RepID=UPI000812E322|nr:DUF2913 family protein [Vibrio parahaemolyticus]
MASIEYRNAISKLVTHALLHLRSHIAAQTRFVTVEQRNALVVKWLKSQTTKKEYASIKKDIKTLILIGRKRDGNVEQRLWVLNGLNEQARTDTTDIDLLYRYLSRLEEHGYTSSLATDVELSADVICISETDIEKGFDDRSKQIKPMPFVMRTQNPEALLKLSEQVSQHHQLELIKSENGLAYYAIHLNE